MGWRRVRAIDVTVFYVAAGVSRFEVVALHFVGSL